MRILVQSATGDGLSVALRLQAEDHDVSINIAKDNFREVGSGLIPTHDDTLAIADDADFVIFDTIGFGGMADALREQGVPILGGSTFQDRLELDRIFAIRLFSSLGLAVPRTEFFDPPDFDEAKAYAETVNTKLVFKASGNVACDKTFIADDGEEMVDYLDHLSETMEDEEGRLPPFVLQHFVPGTEVSTERWYTDGRPVPALGNSTWECKKFLVGNLGPSVGCAGNVVVPHHHERWVAQTTAKLDRLAATHGVCGPLDLNCIVSNERVAYVLEATARFGYDAIQTFCALWGMPIGEVLYGCAVGEMPVVQFTSPVSAGVHVSVPPYPGQHTDDARGTPVVDDVLEEEAVWPNDVMLKDDRLVIAGAYASAYVVTATGKTVQDAVQSCYRWLKSARLPDRQYRTDLLEEVLPRMRALDRMGLLPLGTMLNGRAAA